MIGQDVAGYEITGLLGHGAQGTVYAARDRRLQREVAIKVLLPQLTRDEGRVRRFFDEARAASSVRHPGVVQVLDSGRDEQGRVYIVMELLAGESLYERLRRGPMAMAEAIAILRQLAGALGALHGHADASGAPAPIVHRDLKPENVFLADDGERARVVILDLGIATLAARGLDGGAGAGPTGTPPYVAPEQFGGGPVDHRADLYALGCLLYEMVTGTPPFGFGGVDELARAHRDEPPPALADGAPHVPPTLDALAARLVAKHPGARPACCGDLARELERLGVDGEVCARGRARPPLTTLVPRRPAESAAAGAGWRERAWRGLLQVPPWAAAGWACLAGAVLLGASIVAGVGDSYVAAPNWGFTYVVLAPLVLFFMVKAIQRCDAALRELGARGMIRGDGRPDASVAAATGRAGASLVGLTAVIAAAAIASSIGEWWHRARRAPVPGAWWTESPAMGVAGAVLQGAFIAVIIGFAVHCVAWAQLLHGWTSPRSPLRLRGIDPAVDSRRGFGPLEEPLLLSVVAGVLVQVALYLSNAQHIAEVRRVPILALVNPAGGGATGLLDMGTGRYPSGIPIIASAMVVGFVGASLFVVRRSIRAAAGGTGWPLGQPHPAVAVALLAVGLVATVLVRLGPLVLAGAIVAGVWYSARRAAA